MVKDGKKFHEIQPNTAYRFVVVHLVLKKRRALGSKPDKTTFFAIVQIILHEVRRFTSPFLNIHHCDKWLPLCIPLNMYHVGIHGSTPKPLDLYKFWWLDTDSRCVLAAPPAASSKMEINREIVFGWKASKPIKIPLQAQVDRKYTNTAEAQDPPTH